MCSWHTHSRVVCVSCALYHHVRRGTRCTICAVPCALYHVRCTICAIPFAPYHARCIMWCRRADPRARSGRSVHGVVHSRSGGQAVTCYVFLSSLLLRAVQFPQLWIVVFRSTRTRQRNRHDDMAPAQSGCVAMPTPCHHVVMSCARRAGRRRRASPRVPSRHHVMAVRFGSTPFPHGCWDRPIGIGVRARARGGAGWRGRRERRGAPCVVYGSTCAFLIQKSRSVKSQSSELPRPSKVDLHGSRASTRGSSSVPLRFLSSDHARPVPLRLLSGTHAASRRSLNAVMPSLASSEWKSF